MPPTKRWMLDKYVPMMQDCYAYCFSSKAKDRHVRRLLVSRLVTNTTAKIRLRVDIIDWLDFTLDRSTRLESTRLKIDRSTRSISRSSLISKQSMPFWLPTELYICVRTLVIPLQSIYFQASCARSPHQKNRGRTSLLLPRRKNPGQATAWRTHINDCGLPMLNVRVLQLPTVRRPGQEPSPS